MSSKKTLTTEERNAITWLQRQPGVTSVVPSRRSGSQHQHRPGTTKVVEADAKGVLLRLYGKTGLRTLYIHAPATPERDRWLKALAEAGSAQELVSAEPTKLTHTVPKAESFPATVPAPKPLDPEAAQLYDVTPDLAAKWLERNTRNRPMRDSIVLKYAADMRDGKWKVVGDAIQFDKNGAVVNGQHRLWAVLESGVTVRMLVMFDLDPDVVYVLDDHFKRRLVDIIHIGQPGTGIQVKHAAIARAMMFPLTMIDQRGTLARASRQRQVEFLNRHIDAITFAMSDCLHGKSVRGITNSNILSGVARAYYTQDRERLKQFGSVLVSGVMDSKGDHAAILLRNWMMNQDTRMARAQADVIRAKAERAIYGFLHREQATNLRPASEELFPLPEEQTPKGDALPKIKQLAKGKA